MKTVNQIMTDHVMSIKVSTPFTVACRAFQNLGLRHLPVLDDNGRVIGMFSIYDAMTTLNRILTHNDLNEDKVNELTSVEEVMTASNLITLDYNDKVSEAVEIFSSTDVHSILIFKDNRLAGIVTPNDVIRTTTTQEVLSR